MRLFVAFATLLFCVSLAAGEPQAGVLLAKGKLTTKATANGVNIRLTGPAGASKSTSYFTFTSETKLWLGMMPGKLEDFEADRDVVVAYVVSGKNKIATELRVEAPTTEEEKEKQVRALKASIEKAKADIAGWEKELTKLQADVGYLDPANLKIGQIGKFPAQDATKHFKVVEVNGQKDSVLRYVGAKSPVQPFVLFNVPTAGWVDGAIVPLDDVYEVRSTILHRGATRFVVVPKGTDSRIK